VETSGGIMVQDSLKLHTFADDRLEVSSTEVVAVKVDGERVWVHMRDLLSFTMIEAKNPEDVLKWGRVSGKLEGENEFEL
jgi:hypothetical protein